MEKKERRAMVARVALLKEGSFIGIGFRYVRYYYVGFRFFHIIERRNYKQVWKGFYKKIVDQGDILFL